MRSWKRIAELTLNYAVVVKVVYRTEGGRTQFVCLTAEDVIRVLRKLLHGSAEIAEMEIYPL